MALHVRIEVPPFPDAIEAVAEGVVLLNCVLFEHAAARGVEMPSLYDTHVVYRREAPGAEWWEDARDVLGVAGDGEGDCEDLANYMSAWYRVFGDDEDAHTIIKRTTRGTFHAVVQRGDGSVEDPSRILVNAERARKGTR
jgi:hypothetical protein